MREYTKTPQYWKDIREKVKELHKKTQIKKGGVKIMENFKAGVNEFAEQNKKAKTILDLFLSSHNVDIELFNIKTTLEKFIFIMSFNISKEQLNDIYPNIPVEQYYSRMRQSIIYNFKIPGNPYENDLWEEDIDILQDKKKEYIQILEKKEKFKNEMP